MRHFIIPDTHVKDGVPLEHLGWAGKYIAEKKPEVIIHLGDFADMSSLSSYDKGKKSFEGRRYTKDLAAAKKGMYLLMDPIARAKAKDKTWNPRMVLTLGNHEDRITRAIDNDSKLEGLISLSDLPYQDWEVVPYLDPISIHGISYCHYFTSGILGKPVASARMLNTKKHVSCVMGHVQKKEIDIQYTGDGKRITSIFAGTFYQHNEEYLNPQGNKHWRGCWMLHQVANGEYDEMPIAMKYLKEKYGSK